MSISTAAQKDLRDRLFDMAKNGREQYVAYFKDANLGKPAPNDAEFMMWWQLHLDPNGPLYVPGGIYADSSPQDWLHCLPLTEGGKQLMARAVRLAHPQPDAVGMPPSVAAALGANMPPSLAPPVGPPKPLAQGDAFYQPDHETAAISGTLGGVQ